MERQVKRISKGAQIIPVDSRQWNLKNKKSYLPGGLLTIMFEKCKPYVERKNIKIGRLGNWSAISLQHKSKRLELINLYRIPATSSHGPYCSATQYAKVDGKIKSVATYRKEIFQEIIKHVKEQNITDVIVAGDFNQGISEKAVRDFFEAIEVLDVHSKLNNVAITQLDKTFKQGSRAIDSIAASRGVMNYIEGSRLVNYSEIVESDHRGYIIDVAMEDYFEMEFSQWDNIDKVMLNPSKRSHRETFVEEIERQLEIYNIEEEIEQMSIHTTKHQMEQMDQLLTRIFTAATKKVEGMRRNIPYSAEKMKRRANLLYWKMKLRKEEKKVVDEELMEKRKVEACIVEESNEIHQIKEYIKQAIEKWNDIIECGKEIREKELLDYHHSEVVCENDDQRKKKEKIISGIKRSLNREHAFYYISRHVGKGEREGIKRIHEVDDNNKIIKTYVDRESIEDRIIKYNEMHFTKAHNTIAYRDRIYARLRDDEVRDKILDGRLSESECDDERVYEFLKLLKQPNRRISQKVISIAEWEKVVRKSKKRSASSIFSKRTYAVYKCSLGSDRMTLILVSYYNIIIANGYYPKRWLKILDAILGKGKGMIIGKLRTITLIEADLQNIMRIYLDDEIEEKIESDERFSKSNYGSRKNYSIETAILEKRLTFDNSLLSGKSTIYHLTDLQSCYDRQLANIGGIVEE